MSDLSLSSFSAELERLVAAAAPAVVAVHSHRSRASGFVWRKGLVVTADEALAEEGEIAVVLPGGAAKKATLAGRDPSTNVALLRVEGADAAPARLDASTVKPGAIVMNVDRDGPGAAAGLAQGDVIAAWDGRPIESVSALRRALGPESVGSKAVLSLKRAGAATQVTITIGERPRH